MSVSTHARMTGNRWTKVVTPEIEYFIECHRASRGDVQTLLHYREWVSKFAGFLGETTLLQASKKDVRAFIIHLAQDRKLKPTSQKSAFSAISSFFSFAVEEEYIDKNPCTGVAKIKIPERVPKTLTPFEVEHVKKTSRHAGQNEKNVIRDDAIIEFLLSSGLRRSEVATVRVEDLQLENRYALIIGKGNKQRKVFFTEKCAIMLEAWLRVRPMSIYKNLFVSRTGQPLLPHSMYVLARRRFKARGISATMHDLRRTYATTLYGKGMDILKIQKLLGHTNIATTQKYVAVAEDDLRNSYDAATS